jgi:hypothetical protein
MAQIRQSDYGLGVKVKVPQSLKDAFSLRGIGKINLPYASPRRQAANGAECDQTVLSNRLDLYQKSPDSGERQYKSRI